MSFELFIVGGGVAGAAAALRAAQYKIATAWALGDGKTKKRSRGRWVLNIDNMIGVHPGLVLDQIEDAFPEGPPHLHLGTVHLVDNVKRRLDAEYPEVRRIESAVTAARRTDDGFEVDTPEGSLAARHLVLATGVMDRQPHIAKSRGGAVRDLPSWIYPFANRESVLYCIRCEGHLTRDSRVAVIGHGSGAAEVALMLAERYGTVCALLANGEPMEISPDQHRLIEHHGIAVKPGRIVDLVGEGAPHKGVLQSVVLEGGERIEVQFALVALGLYRAYNDLARMLGASLAPGEGPEDARRVLVNHRGETDVRGLFCVGDLAVREDEGVMMQVYTAQEYAVRAVDTVDWRRRKRGRDAVLGSD